MAPTGDGSTGPELPAESRIQCASAGTRPTMVAVVDAPIISAGAVPRSDAYRAPRALRWRRLSALRSSGTTRSRSSSRWRSTVAASSPAGLGEAVRGRDARLHVGQPLLDVPLLRQQVPGQQLTAGHPSQLRVDDQFLGHLVADQPVGQQPEGVHLRVPRSLAEMGDGSPDHPVIHVDEVENVGAALSRHGTLTHDDFGTRRRPPANPHPHRTPVERYCTLMRGPPTRTDLGTECCQVRWQLPPMTSRSPAPRSKRRAGPPPVGRSRNRRRSPSDSTATRVSDDEFRPMVSPCQATLSVPSR